MLDGWFANKPKDNPEMLERLRQFENETRASFQGTLAASITIRAEPREASERALEMALTASSFLRFLSKANWTSKIKSFALPVGLENSKGWHSFHLTDGKMTSLANSAINEGP